MLNYISRNFQRLYFKNWIIGVGFCDITSIIINKNFDPQIKWLFNKTPEKFQADPFPISINNGKIKILFEEFSRELNYGNISILSLDENFNQTSKKKLLDTNSHLSYPFAITEGDRTFVFPESKKSGKLSCYEYDHEHESLQFVKDIIDLPLLDSTILKYKDKFWIFGTLANDKTGYELNVFHSAYILGPYIEHVQNPIKTGLNATRSAGHFIIVDGNIYRPAQNCEIEYGESITINKIIELNESNVIEEPYMDIRINKNNRHNRGIHTIHTINAVDNIIIVDGILRIFSPFQKFRKFTNDLRKRWEKSKNII